MTITIQRSAFFEAIQKHNPSSIAVINHDSGAAFSYGTLLGDVACAKERLLQTAGRDDISGERIAFLVENGYDYVGMQSTLSLPLIISNESDIDNYSHTPVCSSLQCYCCTSSAVVPYGRAETCHQQ